MAEVELVKYDHGIVASGPRLRAGQKINKKKKIARAAFGKWTESKPIDDAKAMEVIKSDVNSLFFRTEEHSSGSPGSQGLKGSRQYR